MRPEDVGPQQLSLGAVNSLEANYAETMRRLLLDK